MRIFCTLLGHTWIHETLVPHRSWHTTKQGHTLVQAELKPGDVRHVDRCVRCGTERDAGARHHDGDVVDGEAQDAEEPQPEAGAEEA